MSSVRTSQLSFSHGSSIESCDKLMKGHLCILCVMDEMLSTAMLKCHIEMTHFKRAVFYKLAGKAGKKLYVALL